MNLNDFHFIRPFWLLAFLPYVALLFFVWKHKINVKTWTEICDTTLLPFLLEHKVTKQNHLYHVLGGLIGFLSIIALAAPTWERLPAPAFRNDAGLVILLDLSKSMNAQDLKPNRLSRARYKISDILKQRKDGQTALIVYSQNAFTVTPLTNDVETIENQLSALSPEIMPAQGNQPQIALEKAVNLLKQAGLQKGQILLITSEVDSENTHHFSELVSSAYQLFILGVGTKEGAPIPISGGFLKDNAGSIIVSKLDEAQLTRLATRGGGVYKTITVDDSDIKVLTQPINNAKNNTGKKIDALLEQWDDKGVWFVLAILPIAAFSFRKGLLCVFFVLFLPFPKNSYAFEWRDIWKNQNQQAFQDYRQQHFEAAAKKFESPYNQGNALAKMGKLEEAIAAYKRALEQNPNDEDAQFNKNLVEKWLEKQKQKQQEQQKDAQNKQNDSEKNQENQDSQQAQTNQKPEQKEEKTNNQKQEQHENSQQNTDSKPQPQENQEKTDNSQQKPFENNQNTEENKEQSTIEKEKQQANEQWLNRVPDDPAGLLRRKFKYQYSQKQN